MSTFFEPLADTPLSSEQSAVVQQLLNTLSSEQKIWLSGYLYGQAKQERPSHPLPESVAASVTILYASETGNAKELAKEAAAGLAADHLQVNLSSMEDYPRNKLKTEKLLLIVTSTHGEGEPPRMALDLYDYLHSPKAPKLAGLEYAVLALGDSSYEFFCQTGKDFDKRLSELGAKPLLERVECDVDYEKPAQDWLAKVKQSLGQKTAHPEAAQGAHPQLSLVAGLALAQAPSPAAVYSKKVPYASEILENINLNGRGSTKETRHIELRAPVSGMAHEPGDALGVWPQNPTELVDRLLALLHLDESTEVVARDKPVSLREALTEHCDLATLTEPLLRQWAKQSDSVFLRTVANGAKSSLKEFLRQHHLIDLAETYPARSLSPQTLVDDLRTLQPRLYSIASSAKWAEEEIHLTVAPLHFTHHQQLRPGICSNYLAGRQLGQPVKVFVQRNEAFRLPNDSKMPIVMIGAGTGVAPFRAFMQELEALGQKRPTWLFFGDRQFRTDFLYQAEWQQSLKKGFLQRMDVAFSRDQEQKIYVQHKLHDRQRELYALLEEGAHLYVCGDAAGMAKGVEQALADIVAAEKSISREYAEEYVRNLKKAKRFLLDVY